MFTTHFGNRINPATILELIMECEQKWNIIHKCFKDIMQAKEIEEGHCGILMVFKDNLDTA